MNDIGVDDASSFPVLRECPFSLPVEYKRLNGKGRINQVRMSDGRPAWLITKNEDARAVLSDSRFSSEKLRPGFPELSPGGLKKLTYFAPFLVNMDGAEHAQARRALLSEFSVRRVAVLKPQIQQIADDAIDVVLAHPAKPVDLVEHLSNRVPSLVLQEFIGVPHTDLDTVQRNTEYLLRHAKTEAEQDEAAANLHRHLDRIIAAKEDDLDDDLLSRQIIRSREENGGRVDRFELASLVQLLQIAGHASSAAMISLGVLALLSNPDQLKEITSDPGKTPTAVEELLRYLSVTDTGPLRLALEDVEVAGVLIRAGSGVIIPTLPANRDHDAFPDPDTLNVLRTPSTRHVAFGFGAHQCLGQNLVRAELQIVIDTLFRRIPNIRIVRDVGELSFRYNSQFYGPCELPVAW